jgi:CBS domain-containing protein
MTPALEGIPPNATIHAAARKMRDLDVGLLPVVERHEVIGIVTDRDITIRATAEGADPKQTTINQVMSSEIFTCIHDDDLRKAAQIMMRYQVRRLVVQDTTGDFVGILALSDVARNKPAQRYSAEVLEAVSQPTE